MFVRPISGSPRTTRSRSTRALTMLGYAITVCALSGLGSGSAVAATNPKTPESSADASAVQATDVTSFGISPGSIEFPDAARGADMASEIIVFNKSSETATFVASSAGPVSAWIKLGPPAASVSTYTFSAVPGRTPVHVAMSIPGNTPNGTYDGVVRLTAEATAGATGSGVSITFEASVSVTVTGSQRATATFSNLAVASSEIGRPAEIRATIANTGNVALPVSATARIARNGSLVETLTTPPQPQVILPGQSGDVILQWATVDALPGDYTVDVDAQANGASLGSKQNTLRIEAPGKLQRALKVDALAVSQPADARPILRGTVHNNGEIAGRTVVRVTVERQGQPESSVQSDSFYIAPGQTIPFVINLPLPSSGSHQAVVTAELEDYRSPVARTSFVVSGNDSSLPLLSIVAGIGTLAVLAGIVRSRRSRADHRTGHQGGQSRPAPITRNRATPAADVAPADSNDALAPDDRRQLQQL